MFSYVPLAAVVYTAIGLAGFVAGTIARRQVGTRATVGAVASLATALAATPIWLMPLVSLGDQGIIELALLWLWMPVLQLISLLLFVLASTSRFTSPAR